MIQVRIFHRYPLKRLPWKLERPKKVLFARALSLDPFLEGLNWVGWKIDTQTLPEQIRCNRDRSGHDISSLAQGI
jgi:hypothetical protein